MWRKAATLNKCYFLFYLSKIETKFCKTQPVWKKNAATRWENDTPQNNQERMEKNTSPGKEKN